MNGSNTRRGYSFVLVLALVSIAAFAQAPHVRTDCSSTASLLQLAGNEKALPLYVAPQDAETLRLVARAFAGDVEHVTGVRPRILSSLDGESEAILVGTLGNSPIIDALAQSGRLDVSAIRGNWESAVTATIDHPTPGLQHAVVIAGSDRRGAAYALFSISREMGVSPWAWWADVPVPHANAVCIDYGTRIQGEPSVPYRGIFLNDEDWGLRPWAAKNMDPQVNNLGPHTYRQIFELMLRLRANTLWPAMHPGTLPFNALPENAQLANQWGIVMGASHSEALLRNNVGEWDEKRDGPWNYQTNAAAIDAYWRKRLQTNGKFENYYTIGMRGLHDSGLEAEGSVTEKARLIEKVMDSQRSMLKSEVDPQLERIPQVIWLYKEALELYRAGMKIPDDVTLGWTDDNYGYLRQLPDGDEQKRKGGSGIYYHVSYWGFPHDYLWLCSTPPALIREEMTKAWDHGARRFWMLNVGDIKPAESDIDYFLQLAWDEPMTAQVSQSEFLQRWFGEQFPPQLARQISEIQTEYYRLNFIRKPEFMGFNGYDDGVRRTDFNPLAWGDQNRKRLEDWQRLNDRVDAMQAAIPAPYRAAFFELVAYPVQAAAAQNAKFLWTDRSYLDASGHSSALAEEDARKAHESYARIQSLTRTYNQLEDGKWEGMMDAAPRNREVFKMPTTAKEDHSDQARPASWAAPSADAKGRIESSSSHGFCEFQATVSIPAAHFTRKQDRPDARWQILDALGISGSSLILGRPGQMETIANPDSPEGSPWVEYEVHTTSSQSAVLSIYLLPTFPVDSRHRLRFALQVDGQKPHMLDLSGAGEWQENSAPTWSANVLRNAGQLTVQLGSLGAGVHTLRLLYIDPGVAFEHLTLSYPGSAPAYPAPPETRCAQ